ncbi:MAG TPA: hypothetical protein VJB59_03080 [Bdellovibrionota bacterium]|nr:hypothetical protein [Bdellovibrionota bacterium]
MKKVLILMGLALMAAQPAFASDHVNPLIQSSFSSITPMNLINWKVGDTAEYNVSLGSFGIQGKMIKSVTKDEGTALWLRQDLNLSIQKQVADALINKADGKILKIIVDGKEQAIPDDKVEVISQDYGEITVPAGTFQAIHIIAKTKQISKLEVWANPRDTVMDGTLKQIAETSLFPLTMELTSFKRGQ